MYAGTYTEHVHKKYFLCLQSDILLTYSCLESQQVNTIYLQKGMKPKKWYGDMVVKLVNMSFNYV